MPVQHTILGHLIGWGLPRRYEDAATEGLAFLLQRYPAIRDRFIALLRAAQPGLPEDLQFATHVSTGRTDLIGRHAEHPRVIVASKFAAALADEQPAQHLRELAGESPALLLCVAPEWRRGYLVRELTERLKSAGVAHREPAAHTIDVDGRRIHVAGWAAVLAALAEAADDDARANLEQLAGVCRVADDSESRPLVREELTDPQVPGRILQYVKIVHAVVDRGSDAFRKISGSQSAPFALGRKIQLGGDKGPVAWLGVDLPRWHKHETGPLWLTFDWNLGQARSVKERLQAWASEHQRVLCDIDDGVMLHLELLCGREQQTVVDDVAAQLRAVADQLRKKP
jgi:hypothetical protein